MRYPSFLFLALAAFYRTDAETITGNGDSTNTISLAAGEVALIQTAVVTPWTTADRVSLWEAGGKRADLSFNWPQPGPNVAAPVILAGPGTLAVSFPHIITFQRYRLTNATTLIVGSEPARIPIKADQRLLVIGCTYYGGPRDASAALIQSGEEFTPAIKDTQRRQIYFSSAPTVFDGPWDLILWAEQPRVVTYLLEARKIQAPTPVLNNNQDKAVEIQSSEDGDEWEVASTILPETNGRQFFRLKTK
ncbi:MAG: hypothetical protein DMF62_03135 [Acidobacteria bacterium]|nr:MAG: hypothetical protein DMF62_03135 [Acidobacteriota bacterium]